MELSGTDQTFSFCDDGDWPLNIVCGQLSRSELAGVVPAFQVSFVPKHTYFVAVDVSVDEGELSILCTNVGGEEFASFRAGHQESLEALRAKLKKHIPDGVSLTLTDALSGRILCPSSGDDTDSSVLVDILAIVRAE